MKKGGPGLHLCLSLALPQAQLLQKSDFYFRIFLSFKIVERIWTLWARSMHSWAGNLGKLYLFFLLDFFGCYFFGKSSQNSYLKYKRAIKCIIINNRKIEIIPSWYFTLAFPSMKKGKGFWSRSAYLSAWGRHESQRVDKYEIEHFTKYCNFNHSMYWNYGNEKKGKMSTQQPKNHNF